MCCSFFHFFFSDVHQFTGELCSESNRHRQTKAACGFCSSLLIPAGARISSNSWGSRIGANLYVWMETTPFSCFPWAGEVRGRWKKWGRRRDLAWEAGGNPQSLFLICFRQISPTPSIFAVSLAPCLSLKPSGYIRRGDLLSFDHRWVFRVSCNIRIWKGRDDGSCLVEKAADLMWSKSRQIRQGLLLQALLMWGYSLFHESSQFQHHLKGFERQLWNMPRTLFLSIWGCLGKLWAAQKKKKKKDTGTVCLQTQQDDQETSTLFSHLRCYFCKHMAWS